MIAITDALCPPALSLSLVRACDIGDADNVQTTSVTLVLSIWISLCFEFSSVTYYQATPFSREMISLTL